MQGQEALIPQAISTPTLPGVELAAPLTEMIGAPIHPLITYSGVAAYRYYTTDAAQRATLPWYSQPKAFFGIFAMLAICWSAKSVPFLANFVSPIQGVIDNLARMALLPLTVSGFASAVASSAEGLGFAGMKVPLPLASGMFSEMAFVALTQPLIYYVALVFGGAVFLLLWVVTLFSDVVVYTVDPGGLLDLLYELGKVVVLVVTFLLSIFIPVFCLVLLGSYIMGAGFAFPKLSARFKRLKQKVPSDTLMNS